MAFRLRQRPSAVADTPEQFYNDLRSKRIPGLLAHQADVLREYAARALKSPDVAFQLPTGSGKTLVGLVLGEWRRRKNSERVVYLCPTNQLVRQVAHQAETRYGIPVRVFTGPAAEYGARDRAAYQNAEAIAVTSYSALFNTNPFFVDPQVIILDDAHAAENYIASYWSLRIERSNKAHRPAFSAVAAALRAHIPHLDYSRLAGERDVSSNPTWVEKLPLPVLDQLAPELVAILDENVQKTDLRYSWRVLRDHLSACHLYYGATEILLRPLLPPTETHRPFAQATQRVYMSATLGEGGELERITGRRQIARLPIPPGWDSQGTGRRLFMFPERSLDPPDATAVVGDVIREAGRALYLVPNGQMAILGPIVKTTDRRK